MLLSRKGFCEDIGDLIFGIDMNEFDISFFDMISNEMMSNFDVFGSRVKDRIFGNLNGASIVTHDWYFAEA